jgi:NADH-quinone oxidoreductase subunit L
MGGLSRQMPFVRTVFLIGALGLAGLPIANGFFSKELVLEYGLHDGPFGWYLVMLLGAGITAAYTLRMVYLVFNAPAGALKARHDAPLAMRIALGALATATLSTWLLAGAFEKLLAETLPYHGLHAASLAELLSEILLAPATWLTVGVVLLSGLAWWTLRDSRLSRRLAPAAAFARQGLGFEYLNQLVVRSTRALAAGLQRSQTGQLNWNIFGLLAALLVVLLILTQSV